MLAGRLEHGVGAVHVDADALDGAVAHQERADRGREVEDGADAGGEVVDEVGVEHRATVERQGGVIGHRAQVVRRAGGQVVERDDLVPGPEEVLHEVGPDESGRAGDERSHHAPPTRVRGAGASAGRGGGATSPSTSVTPASGRRCASSRS